MTVQKRILRFWTAFGILLAVAIGVITLSHRWHSIFPSREVSELYTRYENVEGIEVSFIKNFRVNDTVAVDVTLLEATDSAGWARMKEDFGIFDVEDFPLEERELVRESFGDHITARRVSPDKNYKMPDSNICNNDVFTCERATKRIVVFHTANMVDQYIVEYFIYDLTTSNETLNIKNYEESI